MVKRILNAWKPTESQINEQFYWTEYTPMQQARVCDDEKSMELLLEFGAHLTEEDREFIEEQKRKQEESPLKKLKV